MQTGTTAYTCNKGRAPTTVGWGTYSATVQDGSDPLKLWTLQEYAGSAIPCAWKKRMVVFKYKPGPPKRQATAPRTSLCSTVNDRRQRRVQSRADLGHPRLDLRR